MCAVKRGRKIGHETENFFFAELLPRRCSQIVNVFRTRAMVAKVDRIGNTAIGEYPIDGGDGKQHVGRRFSLCPIEDWRSIRIVHRARPTVEIFKEGFGVWCHLTSLGITCATAGNERLAKRCDRCENDAIRQSARTRSCALDENARNAEGFTSANACCMGNAPLEESTSVAGTHPLYGSWLLEKGKTDEEFVVRGRCPRVNLFPCGHDANFVLVRSGPSSGARPAESHAPPSGPQEARGSTRRPPRRGAISPAGEPTPQADRERRVHRGAAPNHGVPPRA